MNEFDLRIRLIKKKVRDLRLKNKIQISFLFITILTVFAVALLSYEVAKREMVRNSYQTVKELEKQGSERLGERKREFEESSYRILHMSNVEPLLAYSEQGGYHTRCTGEDDGKSPGNERDGWKNRDG